MKKFLTAALGLTLTAVPAAAQMNIPPRADLRSDEKAFFELYKELVETNTTLSHGSCTLAAKQIATRLEAAGIPKSNITLFSVSDHPEEGGIVAVLPGRSKSLKPMLLLGHIDVVEARREDWTRDPFKLHEENGFYYARGVIDDKFMSAVWADTLIRLAQKGAPKLRRTVKMALTCGEETDTAFNGAQYLALQKRDLIDAAFALNEGGGGRTDGKGKLIVQTIQVGEKIYQDYKLRAINPGGHSSLPVPENAINEMADALLKIAAFKFSPEFNDTTRAFFSKGGALRAGEMGKAMAALVENINDKDALAVVDQDKSLRSVIRTTCVSTMIKGGHAVNALPQKVEANVNCRILPGYTPNQIRDQLTTIIGNPKIEVELSRQKPLAKLPPLDPNLINPMVRLAGKHFPGVPVIPSMISGGTDAVYLGSAGIPTYGVPNIWSEPDGNGLHGLNERVEISAVYTARDYLYDLVKLLAR